MNEIKLLYTIGDSWTYGDELENPKKECWPSVLSKDIGCKLINDSKNGGPNDWMFRRTIEWVCQQKSFDDTAVIVGWSEPNRREEDYNTILQGEGMWEQVMKYLYNDELAHYKSICYMVTLQEFLKSKNIKYLFFQPWYDIFGCEKELSRSRKEKKKWLVKDDFQKECYSDSLEIGKIIKNIDGKYLIGPNVPKYIEEYNIRTIMPGDGTGRHPNKKEHKIMSKFIKEKLVELYG
jgi:hypothetical protein